MENTFQGNLIWRLNEKHKDSSVMTLSEHRFFDRYPQVYLTCLMAGHRILVDPRETSLPPQHTSWMRLLERRLELQRDGLDIALGALRRRCRVLPLHRCNSQSPIKLKDGTSIWRVFPSMDINWTEGMGVIVVQGEK